jgi:type VI secretion system protein ImpH
VKPGDNPAILRDLLKDAPDFNFFQAMRLLETLFPDAGRPGTGDELGREAFRVETFNSLAFPAGDVAALLPPKRFRDQREDLEKAQGKELDLERPPTDLDLRTLVREKKVPARLLVTFMGLYGVSSPLPSYFVDPITLRKIEYFELKKFLDYFGHRLYSLFYRAWKKYRHAAHFEPSRPDETTLRLAALTGQWPRRTRDGFASFDLGRIPFARFLGSRVRSAKGLEQLLRGYFGFSRVRVLQFASTWFDIPTPTRLGRAGAAGGLGSGARLGERMEDRVSGFRVDIGPVPGEEFLQMQESLWTRNGDAPPLWKRVRDLIEVYLRDPLFFEVRVLLSSEGVPAPRLASGFLRLGGYTWLGETPKQDVALRF